MENYCRVITPETQLTEEAEDACLTVLECMTYRHKWLFKAREDLDLASKNVRISVGTQSRSFRVLEFNIRILLEESDWNN